jgi:hypothetical protein
MRQDDVDQILRQAHRGPDGSYRAVAVMTPPGRAVGTFRYYGTRQDDPNDVVPHEHRRELRALKVFGAWINLIDLDARHTLDTVITEGDRATIRHYLLIGSALGASAGGPVDFDAGWESLYQRPLARRRLLRLGFVFRPWQTVPYEEHPGLGRFEGHVFDPLTWRPRAPTAAFLSARADDTFWAARRVAAFTREMIEAAAAAGRYSSPEARKLLSDILIVRQGRITAAYLPAVNPLVDFALSADGRLAFRNAAVDASVVPAPPGGYQAAWATFDNATGQAVSIGTTTGPQGGAAPAALPATPGTFVRVEISAVGAAPPAWTMPVGAYFRRNASGWSLVGVERIR